MQIQKKQVEVDSSRRELCAHGDVQFPVEVLHDSLDAFRGRFVPCHWHDEWEFSLVRRGRPLYQINGVPCNIPPGCGVLINSGVSHMVLPQGPEPVEFLTVIVHPRFVSGGPGSAIEQRYLRAFCGAPALAVVPLDEGTGWGRRALAGCLEIDQLFCQRPFGFEVQVKAIFCGMLFSILSAKQGELGQCREGGNGRRLKVLLRYLHAHYPEKIALSELAAQVSLGREACCRLFKQFMGMTVSQYLAEYRVYQSIPLLETGAYSVLEVAALVGFSNASRYAAAFRARMQCGPGEYLRLHPPGAAGGVSTAGRP